MDSTSLESPSASAPAESPKLKWLDWSAIGLSGLCVVHCIVGTAAVALLAAGAVLHGGHGHEHGHDHATHVILFLIAAPVAMLALWRGFAWHRQRRVLAWGGAGLALMLAGIAQPFGHWVELALTLPGVIVLGYAHLLNLRAGVHAR